jgi:integrase
LHRHLLPAWRPTTRIRRISRAHVKALLIRKRQEGLALDTVRNIYAITRTVFSGAVDDGYLSVNPAAKLGRSLGLGVTARQRSEKIKAMTQEQLTAFLAATRKAILPYGPLLRTLALTGMRLGEALGLRPCCPSEGRRPCGSSSS